MTISRENIEFLTTPAPQERQVRLTPDEGAPEVGLTPDNSFEILKSIAKFRRNK
jgi:hypothetical protein